MHPGTLIFASLAAVTICAALAVVLMRNALHSALSLGLSLSGVAGLYASLGSDFLFAAQILIYVSGIAVLILFVVLLSGRASDFVMRQINEQWLAGGLIAAALYWGLTAIYRSLAAPPIAAATDTTFPLAKLMLGDLLVPFELISVVLLAALVGAILFSKPEVEPS